MDKPKKDKPLPKPPTTPFGRKQPLEHEKDQESLTADRLFQAAAEGKLDEFLKKEMPDNEHARNLVSLMMGMSGIPPADIHGGKQLVSAAEMSSQKGGEEQQQSAEPGDVPGDIRQAIMNEDLPDLMDKLRREHEKRHPESRGPEQEAISNPDRKQNMPSIDKETIDALIEISQENAVTLDWLILRALKVYLQEYRKSGKL